MSSLLNNLKTFGLWVGGFFLLVSAHSPQDVLDFWFGDEPLANETMWFSGSTAIDTEIKEKFYDLYCDAKYGRLNHWKETAEGRLALILLLDQFPRNLFRGNGEAFLTDGQALQLTLEDLEIDLSPIEKIFFYMPLMHSEDLQIQQLSVLMFSRLILESEGIIRDRVDHSRSFAKMHKDVITKYGRFPSRNSALNRESSKEELAYLVSNPPF